MTRWMGWAATALALAACGGAEDAPGSSEANVIDGASAEDYPFAALVDIQFDIGLGECSGAVIAPRVALTAAHCTVNAESFRITTPYAPGDDGEPQSAVGVAQTFDWTAPFGSADPSMHDIAVVILDSPIVLERYPEIADDDGALGRKVRYVGRVKEGEASTTELFVSKKVRVRRGDEWGWPHNFATDQVVEEGDSGGPVMRTDGRTLAGVDSGGNSEYGVELFARADLVHDWIAERIAESEAPPEAQPEG